jgi:hypothetical protein
MHTERRKQTLWQIITQSVMPVLIAAFMGWVGSEIVSSKLSYVRLEEKVEGMKVTLEQKIDHVKSTLDFHNEQTTEDRVKNAMRHHRDERLRCTGCHMQKN